MAVAGYELHHFLLEQSCFVRVAASSLNVGADAGELDGLAYGGAACPYATIVDTPIVVHGRGTGVGAGGDFGEITDSSYGLYWMIAPQKQQQQLVQQPVETEEGSKGIRRRIPNRINADFSPQQP